MQSVSITATKPTAPYQLAIPYSSKTNLADHGISLSEAELKLYRAETKSGKVARVPFAEGVALLIGTEGDSLRDFAANAVRASADADLVLDGNGLTSDEVAQLLEGAALGAKTPTQYKSAANKPNFQVLILSDHKDVESAVLGIAEAVVAAREIINTPANDLYPESLAQWAIAQVGDLPIEIEVWDETRLEQERCGGILAVGRGSHRPPRLVKLSYRGGGSHIGLAGKGITFDTGGLSLKPAESMVGMKYDMAGAATVLAATVAVARLGLAVNLTTVLCLAENMPSGTATRPGDVAKIRNGKTVEILNTDAEGRLVLADGLSLLSELGCDHIIDVATLTGAATIALGRRYTGVMGTGSTVSAVESAAEKTAEMVWHMPLPAELRPLLDSELADMTNVKIGNRAGGMLIGGLFLKEFVPEGANWAHLDIASAANNDNSPYSVYPQGATGIMIRTLVQLAQDLAGQQ